MDSKVGVNIYFSDYFGVTSDEVEEFGAFNVSLINDLPLFVDPFLLFNSRNAEYRNLHDDMITYLRFLRDVSVKGQLSDGLLYAWFMFSEVKQNWLGFSEIGNKGSGLGRNFASALNSNLNKLFTDFGTEQVTQSSHLEKLCLIGTGVGRDNISDFTTNLIKGYLLEYTQRFARDHLLKKQRRLVRVEKVAFNYQTQTWQPLEFELPFLFNDYVILTPQDILTKDETWINRSDMVRDYWRIVNSVPDEQLRGQLENYFLKMLRTTHIKHTQKEKDAIVAAAFQEYPVLLDYYIKFKEDNGDKAVKESENLVEESKQFYIEQIRKFVGELNIGTGFYKLNGNTFEEAMQRVLFLKDVVENKGGQRIFYDARGKPVRKETDLHILYRLTWFATPSDVSREVNDGRGPVDFKISIGAFDKTLVEFKLASNSQLEKNLRNQVAIYQKASDAPKSIKVIFYFSRAELNRVNKILKKLNLIGNQNIVLVDARKDNKPSGSKADTDNEDSDFTFDLGDFNFDGMNL